MDGTGIDRRICRQRECRSLVVSLSVSLWRMIFLRGERERGQREGGEDDARKEVKVGEKDRKKMTSRSEERIASTDQKNRGKAGLG